MNSADIILIGAGIIGLSTAYQIARRSKLKITVLEQGGELGLGSSGASSAICRHRYSRNEMVELARDGILAYRNWQVFTGLSAPRASYHQDGIVWINDAGPDWAGREASRLRNLSIEAEVLSNNELLSRFPAMSPCLISPDLETGKEHTCTAGEGFLFEPQGGYFEPVDALHDLRDAALREGVTIQLNTPVSDILVSAGKVKGVRTADENKIECDVVFNTTGPWCNRILAPLGLAESWPLKPTRIQVLHIDRPPELVGKIPICCDSVSGVYFREQNGGQQIVIGSAREEDEREVVDPDDYNTWVDDDFKAARLHGFKHRFPALPQNLNVMGYTGLYTVNQADVHPVVGESPVKGLWLANGFSGHGFKIAPAIGSLLARQLTGEQADFDTTVPAAFLDFNRQPLDVDVKSVLA